MQGPWRRVVYVAAYELIAIVLASAGLLLMGSGSLWQAGTLAAATSAVAVVWNAVFNHLFERWEARRGQAGRSLGVRIAHALGFEGGLAVLLVPLIAWWLDVSLWRALVMDFALLLFFLVYTFVFNWAFDALFGLPASAQGAAGQKPA